MNILRERVVTFAYKSFRKFRKHSNLHFFLLGLLNDIGKYLVALVELGSAQFTEVLYLKYKKPHRQF